MTASSQSRLEFAAKRLRWCLDQPLVCGRHDWGGRVLSALEQLEVAYKNRVDFLESPGGPLEQIAEPHWLPFTTEAKRVSDFRGHCQRLRGRIEALTAQFRTALFMFPAEEPDRTDGTEAGRAFRLFGILRSCATDLADAMDAYRLAEANLLDPARPACRIDQ